MLLYDELWLGICWIDKLTWHMAPLGPFDGQLLTKVSGEYLANFLEQSLIEESTLKPWFIRKPIEMLIFCDHWHLDMEGLSEWTPYGLERIVLPIQFRSSWTTRVCLPLTITGPRTTEICILYIGKKAGIFASWNLYIGILLCEISILVYCQNWNCYFEINILVYWLTFQVYWFFEIWYIGISDPLVQDPNNQTILSVTVHEQVWQLYLSQWHHYSVRYCYPTGCWNWIITVICKFNGPVQ